MESRKLMCFVPNPADNYLYIVTNPYGYAIPAIDLNTLEIEELNGSQCTKSHLELINGVAWLKTPVWVTNPHRINIYQKILLENETN